MSLAERIAAAQAAKTCAVVGCDRARVDDSLFCHTHLADMWRNRLHREPDGTFTEPRTFAARDLTGALRT